MAPIKFEEQLKEQLEKRNLQPSSESWNDLQKRLDKHDKSKKISATWWIGIAASIVGMILIVSQLYKVSDTVDSNPVMVETEASVEEIKAVPEIENVTEELIVADIDDQVEEETTFEQESNSKESDKAVVQEIKKKAINTNDVKETVVAQVDAEKHSDESKIDTEIMTVEDLKIQEVVAEIKSMQNSEVAVSNKEIDSLLKEAQREILRQKIFDNKSQTVNANDLLQDVEIELEQSFRDKVFDALKSNFGSVKTAVAERNN
ncbi:MAG: hypothetical protein HRU26_07635 [Psychroserpens sp.]|nr:hypothetical protein [Psychroserpens sp.]